MRKTETPLKFNSLVKASTLPFGVETSLKVGSMVDDFCDFELKFIEEAFRRRTPFLVDERVVNLKIDSVIIRMFDLEFVEDFLQSIRTEFSNIGDMVILLVLRKIRRKLLFHKEKETEDFFRKK